MVYDDCIVKLSRLEKQENNDLTGYFLLPSGLQLMHDPDRPLPVQYS